MLFHFIGRGSHHSHSGSDSFDDETTSEESWQTIALITIASLLLLWSLLTIIITTVRFFKQLKTYDSERHFPSDKQWRITKILASSTIFFLNIQLYIFYVWLVLIIFDLLSYDSISAYMIRISIEIIAVCGLACLRMSHLWRLKTSFQESIYELSNLTYYLLLTLLILSFILAVICSIIEMILIGNGIEYYYDYYLIVTNYGYGSTFLLQSFLDLIVLFIFCKNLFELTLMQDTNEHYGYPDFWYDNDNNGYAYDNYNNYNNNDAGDMASRREASPSPSLSPSDGGINIDIIDNGSAIDFIKKQQSILSDTQNKLLETAAKQTVLVSISAILSLIISILYFMSLIYSDLQIIAAAAWIISAAIVAQTLWLSFVFADNQYKRICKFCHKFCLGLYQRQTERKITQRFSGEYEQLLD